MNGLLMLYAKQNYVCKYKDFKIYVRLAIALICAAFHHHAVKLYCTGAVIECKKCKAARVSASVRTLTNL